jgi:NADPH:quinone reductase-like Zn-dependent oxidoreductase
VQRDRVPARLGGAERPHAGADLASLVDLVESGRLSPEVGWRGGWDRIAEAAGELFGRRVAGKIVLDIPYLAVLPGQYS